MIGFLSGCTTIESTRVLQKITPSQPSPISSPSPQPQVNSSPTPLEASPSRSIETFRVFQCEEKNGTVLLEQLENPALPRSLSFRIYLPPCFDHYKNQGLPTLYLFHGLYLSDAQWDDLGADEIATDLILKGRLPPFLMVMPREQTGLDMERALIHVLLPYMEDNYQAIPDLCYRALGGISRGAGWSFRIGLKHPTLFGAIGMHSPVILPPDLFYLPKWVDGPNQETLPELWIDVGERDTLRFEVFAFIEELDRLGLPYTWTTEAGEHTPDYWSRRMEDYLRWYAIPWILRRSQPAWY